MGSGKLTRSFVFAVAMVLLAPPACPSCGKLMEAGYFATNGQAAWQQQPARWVLKGGNVFQKTHLIQNWQGWCCATCQMFLVDYSRDVQA